MLFFLLKENYLELDIMYNSNQIINDELDVYIPKLKKHWKSMEFFITNLYMVKKNIKRLLKMIEEKDINVVKMILNYIL